LWSGVIVASVFLESSELAYLIVAQRTGSLISFVLLVINMIAAPRYALMWREGNVAGIAKFSKLSSRMTMIVIVPIVIFTILYASEIMSLFGSGYHSASVLLSIIACGHIVNVATGSVGYLLNMTGHEKDMLTVTMFSGPITIIFSIWFISSWGLVGAAYSTAIGLSLQNLGALWMVKRKLGFWSLG
jgi:O-antigen/teichoic acid export membrane protein